MIKKTFLDLKKAKEIEKEYPTPWYIYDEKGIRENAKKLKAAFSWNKGFKEYFAVKATPNPFILNILKDFSFGLDCSSTTELILAKACGFDGKDIMFSSNDTKEEEFKFANDLGAIINLDDITHIDSVLNICKKLPKTMSCRYNPGGLFTMSNGIMDNPGEAKYGMTKEQIFLAFKRMKSLGVENFGLHSFLASNTLTNEYYPKLATILFELAVEIYKKLDIKVKFINLSGGIGVAYKPEDEENDIYKIGMGVKKAFRDILDVNGLSDISIFTELGRFMLAPYGALVTKAINKKNTYKSYIGVDACAVNLMRPAMYGAYHHITILGKENMEKTEKYDIVGSLCENNDKFAIDRELPRIEKGDFLYIHDTGAHGFSMGYNYNGKLKSAELLLQEDNSIKLIRRAENPNDYFATFDFSDFSKDLI